MNTLSIQPYRLPNSHISIKVLAEGAANVIYQITLDPGSRDIAELDKGHHELEHLSGNFSTLPLLQMIWNNVSSYFYAITSSRS